ncbi:GNAT family N-acetyltransferase [Dermacoccaceae bacterium W4C1]
MLRTFGATRSLGARDAEDLLALCAQDPATNVFVAARVLEGGLARNATALGTDGDLGLRAACWTAANVVPVGCDEDALEVFATRLRRGRRRSSSIFGPASQVLSLWDRLERYWEPARSVRREQPMMEALGRPSEHGRALDPRVRPARVEEVDLVLPASAAMFTEEIGYPPFLASDREYRGLVEGLIRTGRTYVIVEDGEIVFKADVGSLALGVAQIQGVWVAPQRRGEGIATPAMNAVVEQVMDSLAPRVTLYVNDFNTPALRTYEAAGFSRIGTFATVIL